MYWELKNFIRSNNINKLADPYKVFDKWLEYEWDYETYLKHYIWVSDGHLVEFWNSYKEVPQPVEMSNGKTSVYWMLPSKFDQNNPPSAPFL